MRVRLEVQELSRALGESRFHPEPHKGGLTRHRPHEQLGRGLTLPSSKLCERRECELRLELRYRLPFDQVPATEQVRVKRGISGGKATGVVLTAGVSLLATGLSRKQTVLRATCSKCRVTWLIEGVAANKGLCPASPHLALGASPLDRLA
jgi:hypothetical protein